MNRKTIHLLLALSVLALTLTMAGEQVMATSAYSNTSLSGFDTTFSREDIAVIGAEGTSALIQYSRFGFGPSEFPSSLDITNTNLDSAKAWMLFNSEQQDFASYLLRRAVDVPDGMTFYIMYDGSGATVDAKAQASAQLFADYFSVTFYLAVKKVYPNQSFYVFVADSTNDFESTLDLVLQTTSGGFNTLLDKSTIMNSPVKVTGIGALPIGNAKIALGVVAYIQEGAITGGGASPYTLSTSTLFPNKPLTPLSDTGLSRIRFNFPYLITVVPNGITPMTTNPLPYLTGTFIWDLRTPYGAPYSPMPSELSVTFTLDENELKQFPSIAGTVSTSQDLLNQGTLEFNYEFENIGTADAQNLKTVIPIGDQLYDFLSKGFSAYVLADGVSKDSSASADYFLDFSAYSAQVDITSSLPAFNLQFLTLNGWYQDNNSNLIAWMNNITEIPIFDFTFQYDYPFLGTVDITIHLSIQTPNGVPEPVYNAIQDVLLAAYNQTYLLEQMAASSNPIDTLNTYVYGTNGNKPELTTLATAREAFNNTIHDTRLYQYKHFIEFESTDFTPSTITTPLGNVEHVLRYNYTGPITPGETVTASWRINNVPSPSDVFTVVVPSIDYNGQNDYLTLNISNYSFQDLFQFLFAVANYDGRFTSRSIPDDFSWLPTTDPNARFSFGAIFSYQDSNGFGYFGLTNGLNFQYADNDEAVLVAKLTSDKVALRVGDPVTFNLNITNYGNIPAYDVTATLFHSQLARGYRLQRIDSFATMNFGVIQPGESVTQNITVMANSFLGYHPVFAIVDFITDKGEGPANVTDFLDILPQDTWSGAGEATIVTMSNLIGALLQPSTFDLAPAFPNPVLDIQSSSTTPAADGSFTYTLTITNTGGSSTNVTVTQTYNTDELTFTGITETQGTDSQITVGTVGIIQVTGVTLNPGDTLTIEIAFTLNGENAYIPPAMVSYTSMYESELGDRPITGSSFFSNRISSGGSTSLLSLSAEAQATGSAEEQATDTQNYNGYSSATAVGASVQTHDSEVSGKELAFLGTNEVLVSLGMGLAVFAIIKRRKL